MEIKEMALKFVRSHSTISLRRSRSRSLREDLREALLHLRDFERGTKKNTQQLLPLAGNSLEQHVDNVVRFLDELEYSYMRILYAIFGLCSSIKLAVVLRCPPEKLTGAMKVLNGVTSSAVDGLHFEENAFDESLVVNLSVAEDEEQEATSPELRSRMKAVIPDTVIPLTSNIIPTDASSLFQYDVNIGEGEARDFSPEEEETIRLEEESGKK
ncbi:hypothetical protein HKX48_007730 [Thoreauomyces humboldtii]|nr:hypothetical protein HKX48_007730 [Thoreauomyces humboldtii]